MSIDAEYVLRKAIRELRPIIDPEEDYLTIAAAEEKVATTEAKRKRELEDTHAKMKALAKALEAARISSTRPTSVLSAQAHTDMLNDLDASKLSLAKSISEMDGLIGSREAELAALKEEARQLEEYDPAAEHQKELDGTALRLRMYKGLGFQPILDQDGRLVKFIITGESGDIHVAEPRATESHYDFCQRLWKLADS